MKLNEMFTGKYFAAKDFTKPLLLTVRGISEESMGEGNEKKWVVWFEEDDRGCVLNRTRGEDMVTATGSDDTDNWPGKLVVLFKGQTRMKGKVVDCVAVRPVDKDKLEDDDDIPF